MKNNKNKKTNFNAEEPIFPCTRQELDLALCEKGEPIVYKKVKYSGLTKREHVAIAAMQGLLSNSEYPYNISNRIELVRMSVEYADTLLEKLKETTEKCEE